MMFFRKRGAKTEKVYQKKEYMMTETEWAFFGCLCKLLCPYGYVVHPQVPLVSVIKRLRRTAEREELYGIVDFCILDSEYHPLLLIEVDEENGEKASAAQNFEAMRNVIAQANLPLVVLWTNYGVNEMYVRERLKEYLPI